MASADTKDVKAAAKEQAQLLQGPISLTHHTSSVYNKNIYLFGETHDTSTTCVDNKKAVSIVHYLNQVLTSATNVIDVFLERPFAVRDLDFIDDHDTLEQLAKLFAKCNRRTQQKLCPYPNARIHLVDVRQIATHDINWMWHFYQFIFKHVNGFDDLLQIEPQVLDQYIVDIQSNPAGNYIDGKVQSYQEAKEELRINTNLANIDDAKLASSISSFFDPLLTYFQPTVATFDATTGAYTKYIKFFATLGPHVSDDEFKELHALRAKLNNYNLIVINYLLVLMDYYTITRMFRSFKPKTTEYSKPAKDIIIYVGEDHAEHYRKFFEHIGFKQIESTRSDMYVANIGNDDKTTELYSCLDISKIKQPLFN